LDCLHRQMVRYQVCRYVPTSFESYFVESIFSIVE
jgi:hypothetical protein